MGVGVKLILLRCAGYNNVDIKKAEELGMKVARVPAYSPYAVAEHAMALCMSVNRGTHKAYNRVKENDFRLEGLLGYDKFQNKAFEELGGKYVTTDEIFA